MSFEFGKAFLHLVNDEVCDLVEERTFKLKRVVSLVNGATHDLSQNIVASFVARQDSVGNGESSCTRVIRDHTHRKTYLGFGFVIAVRQRCSEIDDRFNEI